MSKVDRSKEKGKTTQLGCRSHLRISSCTTVASLESLFFDPDCCPTLRTACRGSVSEEAGDFLLLALLPLLLLLLLLPLLFISRLLQPVHPPCQPRSIRPAEAVGPPSPSTSNVSSMSIVQIKYAPSHSLRDTN